MCLNDKICTACVVGYYLSLRSTCESVCQPRQVLNHKTFSCQMCPYDCLNCDFEGKCTSCSITDFRVFNPTTLRCVPLPGYYDVRNRTCSSCPKECSNCLSDTVCLSCNVGYFLSGSKCFASCPARYYQLPGPNTCEFCPYDCLSCDSAGNCLSCSADIDFRVFSNSRCVSLQGYFDNLTAISVKCPQ